MKVEIEKFTTSFDSTFDCILHKGKTIDLIKPYKIKKGYLYYSFRTEEKAWIRHSGKLTKEEKQWVIKHEQNARI